MRQFIQNSLIPEEELEPLRQLFRNIDKNFDYQLTKSEFVDGLKQMETSAEPFALTVVMLSTATLFYVLGRVLPGVKGVAASAKASRGDSSVRLGPVAGILAALLFGTVIGIASMPHVGVILASLSVEGQWYQSILPRAFTLHNYTEALSHPLAIGSIRISLFLAAIAVVLDLVVGVIAARLIVRTKIRGRAILDALCMLPRAGPGLAGADGRGRDPRPTPARFTQRG